MPLLLKQSNPVSIECVANFLRMHVKHKEIFLDGVFKISCTKITNALLSDIFRCCKEHYAWIIDSYKLCTCVSLNTMKYLKLL